MRHEQIKTIDDLRVAYNSSLRANPTDLLNMYLMELGLNFSVKRGPSQRQTLDSIISHATNRAANGIERYPVDVYYTGINSILAYFQPIRDAIDGSEGLASDSRAQRDLKRLSELYIEGNVSQALMFMHAKEYVSGLAPSKDDFQNARQLSGMLERFVEKKKLDRALLRHLKVEIERIEYPHRWNRA